MQISPGSEPSVGPQPELAETVQPPQSPPPTDTDVATLRAEVERAEDRYRRALADLDNYRKRVARDGDARAARATVDVLHNWLEVVDSVEMALRIQPDDQGLAALLAQMDAILARNGATRQDAVGQRFDPGLYEAVAVVPAPGETPDQTVVDIARSGFSMADGEILRPAQVVVARRPVGEH